MNFSQLKNFIVSDLYRYSGRCSLAAFLRHYVTSPGFRYSFYLRTGEFLHNNNFLRYTAYPIIKINHRRLSFKYGIDIPIGTNIDTGLYIGHYGGIIVNGRAHIGKNCNLSQGVTIGEKPFGSSKGVPVIGDNVYFAPGAKVIGRINVGNFSIIGPNSVLHYSIDDYSVVSGVPAKVISSEGSRSYIQNPFKI